jgi:hypothetical protein
MFETESDISFMNEDKRIQIVSFMRNYYNNSEKLSLLEKPKKDWNILITIQ